MFDELIKIIFKSLKLDSSLYKDSNNFGETSLYYAGAIIFIDGVASAFAVSAIYKTNIILTGFTSLLTWLFWAILIYVIGVKIFPDPNTNSSFKKVLVTVGFAHAPGILRFFALTPSLIIPIIFLTQFWIFASLIIGIKEIFSFKSTFKSFGVFLIAFLIVAIISVAYVINTLNSLPIN